MLAMLLPILGPVISKILELIPDPNAKAAAQAQFMSALMDASAKADQAQADVNKVEAANSSLFVAGWRPFIGWVCGVALLFQYIARPLALAFKPDLAMPALDSTLWELMFGMLGMGALRSYDKRLGTDTQAVSVVPARPLPRQMAGVQAGMVLGGAGG